MMTPDTLYHIYNRGNQRQRIFFEERNYHYFLEKVKTTFSVDIDLLAYCLMPNHFHFLALTAHSFVPEAFSSRLRTLLSSYTKGIQHQQKFVGSLFQQNTKKKLLPEFQDARTVFEYIHQNPIRANLVQSPDQWRFSSFNEYLTSRSHICNVQLGRDILDLPVQPNLFLEQSLKFIPPIYRR